MPCSKTSVRTTRLGKKYPLVRNVPRKTYVAESKADIENLLVYIDNSDTVSFLFDSEFTSTPSIVASFVSTPSLPQAIANVFIETATSTGATLRTSALTTGFIAVHAMHIEGSATPDYTFSPVVTVLPIMGPANAGAAPSVTSPTVISNPAAVVVYTLYVNGSQVPGYVDVDLSTLSTYNYSVGDVGTSTYVDVTVTNTKGTILVTSNAETIT